MTAIHLQGTIDADGKMRLEVPCNLPPGTTEVVVILGPSQPAKAPVRLGDLYGTCKEAWEGIDAQDYVNRVRDEWER